MVEIVPSPRALARGQRFFAAAALTIIYPAEIASLSS